MIINIRGTSGSGKSTAVRRFMDLSPSTDRFFMKGSIEIHRKPTKKEPSKEPRIYQRKKPLGYRLKFPNCTVSVPGHYETQCGGCDTIPTYDMLFEIIRSEHRVGHHVLFEGVLVAHDVKRCTELWDWLKREPGAFNIIELTESLETCLASVEDRRAIRDEKRKKFPDKIIKNILNPANTIRRYNEVIRSCVQLEELGVPIIRCGREEALEVIKNTFLNELVCT